MPVPEYGGCPWPADPACLGDAWSELTPEVRDRSIALASSTLRRLTAFRVGGCPVTVRPCSPRGYCAPFVPFTGTTGDWMQPGINAGGFWVNSCGCSGSCACTTACEIALPAPVGEIYEIKVDGNVIPTTDYEVQDGRYVVWTNPDEPCPFPATQDLSLPDTLPGTFSITYLNAYPVDQLGAQAVAFLALEFAKACGGKGKCSLPRGVTSVVRNGVSFQVEAGLFPNGRTGIDIVDAFLDLWNPDRLTRPATVWAPGMDRMRRV